MKTINMEIAIMRLFAPRKNIVVPNVSWGMMLKSPDGKYKPLHECDILVLSQNNYATEIEIKISKADVLADKNKRHGHNHGHIARFYFAVPNNLINFALKHIPERAGLYGVGDGGRTKLVRQCKRNTKAHKWSDKERLKLAHLGTMRIVGLKQKIAKR